jgi:hypothetical protein
VKRRAERPRRRRLAAAVALRPGVAALSAIPADRDQLITLLHALTYGDTILASPVAAASSDRILRGRLRMGGVLVASLAPAN